MSHDLTAASCRPCVPAIMIDPTQQDTGQTGQMIPDKLHSERRAGSSGRSLSCPSLPEIATDGRKDASVLGKALPLEGLLGESAADLRR